DDDTEDQSAEDIDLEAEGEPVKLQNSGDYLDAVESAKKWAREAAVLGGLIGKQKAREPDSEYQARIELEANRLIKRVVATGEFYLVRAGNTRKGTGTFYTRPQLAVPTVHRTLEPLCYDKSEDGTLIPKRPEAILALKVCDPACGSASFLVAALHYLTEALYKSLSYHCHLDNPSQSTKISLPFGRPRTNRVGEEIVPFSPDDPVRGDTFVERVKALLRRHVVERCIYGVDINPLAVELARVSLWVETLDPELPFSFLDHKIMVGNALVGCWLDRVEDYPLKAWEREGGDGKDGVRTQRIEEFLKGEKIGNRRTGDGRIKKEMRTVLTELRDKKRGQITCLPEGINTDQTMELARTEYEQLHNLPMNSPDERELFYRDHVQGSVPLQSLKAAMNEWCAIWFWRTDEESLRHVPTPLTFHQPSDEKSAIVQKIAQEVKFFHWELEYPDVFTPERSGFDGMIGNPPWDVMKPNSTEFFTNYDPLYRTADKQAKGLREKELFQEVDGVYEAWIDYSANFRAMSNCVKNLASPFNMSLLRGHENLELQKIWGQKRKNQIGFADPQVPFCHQGSADVNSFKLFLETAHHRLKPNGVIGFIVPSAIYTDSGTKALRELFLEHSSWEWLFSFENRKKIFDIDGRFKFAVVIIKKGGLPSPLKAAFMVHDLQDWERSDPPVFKYDLGLVSLFSPKSKSLPEVRTLRDLAICRKIYGNSFRIGDQEPGWEIKYAREFDMANDSKQFKPREWWTQRGYKPDVFGQWVNPMGDLALPLYEGRMIGQFDFSQKGYVSGRGRSAVWREIPFDHKTYEPQYLMAENVIEENIELRISKIGFMDVTSSTNTRTFISVPIADLPCGNKVPTLSILSNPLNGPIFISGVCNSFTFDYVTRNRLGGTTLNWFIVEECPLPKNINQYLKNNLLIKNSQLSFIHRRFAPEWLKLAHQYPDMFGFDPLQGIPHQIPREWKHWWAVTETDRLRLRLEIDALVADLYGLDPDDFDWILKDDPTDPKGFHRVDKQLPYRERFTGLAAAAFRALKEGKWSAESASSLSNDEFFEILGIPELTNPTAATALGHSEPLIRKRQGCHVWRPEEFLPEDPRHGWTWEHCWQDAVSLLGSEEAVRAYIEGKGETAEDIVSGGTVTNHPDGKKPSEQVDLFGNPIEKSVRQKKLF
ncbi:MAG: hypothetical protein WCJ40_20280, partial [Planctomycetota bacterium]